MNTVDKITKEVWNLVNYTKDVTKSNLAKSNTDLGLSEAQLSAVSKLVESAVEQSYQRFVPAFQKGLVSLLRDDQNKKPTAKKLK